MVFFTQLFAKPTVLGILTVVLLLPAADTAALPLAEPAPGGVALVRLSPDHAPTPAARFRKRRVMVVKDGGYWTAVVGLALGIAPGEYSVTASVDGGKIQRHRFRVQAKEYASQYLAIENKRLVDPTAEDLRRIGREKRLMNAAFRAWKAQDEIELDFIAPVAGPVSSPFGLRRFFNNAPRKPHSGIDIAAPKGTAVRAPAAGRVARTGNYFFNGNTVMIDHGQGLVSMFSHLDAITVRTGQRLRRGDKLGEVGMSGRATGPHLHWTVSLNDSRVDPALFVPRPHAAAAPPAESAP